MRAVHSCNSWLSILILFLFIFFSLSGGTWSSEVRVVLLDKKTGIKINWGCVQREIPRFEGTVEF